MTIVHQTRTAIGVEGFFSSDRGPIDRAVEGVDALESLVSDVVRESKALLGDLRQLVHQMAGRAGAAVAAAGDTDRDVGATLGPYRIDRFVRSGGMGEIYRAVDERLGRVVALKVLPRRRGSDAHGRRRLLDEARLLSSVRHPNVCTLYDIGASGGIDYLVMEYLEGRTLEERMADRPVTTQEALAIGRQVASALEAAHNAGIVHRDLKPANIMLVGRDDAGPEVKLLDFGLASVIDRRQTDLGFDASECPTRTNFSQIEGTWPYMAPEMFGCGELDSRADIWALGVVLYEMICGRRPFGQRSAAALAAAILRIEPTPPAQLNAACGRQLSATIERCLQKDRSRRWQSCADLARRLEDRALSRERRRSKTRAIVDRMATTAALCTTLIAAPMASRADESGVLVPSPVSVATAGAASSTTLDRDQMEQMLLQGRIGRRHGLAVGVSRSSKAVVTWRGMSHDAHIQTIDTFIGSARFVNQSDCYRYNVAAFRLDRMLGLGMVPVSVVRTIDGRSAAVTWWVDDVAMMELERRKRGLDPVDRRDWSAQMQRAFVFQELIANSDNNQTNQLITKDWRIWLVDFTRAFRVDRNLTGPTTLRRLDDRVRAALERLDLTSLREEMRGLLDGRQIRTILIRRDLILSHLGTSVSSAGTGSRARADRDRES
jgi:serine/threonine protein kinase